MSLYNMIHGVNQTTFFILPMLGEHPDEYPRFRDCFTSDEEHPEYDNMIHIYTRVGGNNRGCGYGEDELIADPLFLATFDDSFDNTYATYIFDIPEEFEDDFKLIQKGKITETSDMYKQKVVDVFPKIKDKLNMIFNMDLNFMTKK